MKNKLYILNLILLTFLLTACASISPLAEQNNPIKIWSQNANGQYNTLNVVDENTGVNYIVVSFNDGNYVGGLSMTPRLNADGTLYITK
jgi:uncharacterized lipoprotein YajG